MMLNAKFCLSFEKICFIINNIAATSKIIISIHTVFCNLNLFF